MAQEFWNRAENKPLLEAVSQGKEVIWINERLTSTEEAMSQIQLTMADIDDAEARLARFAPFIQKVFPETAPRNGLIESPLTEIPKMQKKLEEEYQTSIPGRLFLKQDSHLAISGSIKARGGIYEVLKHAEDLALEYGKIKVTDDYSVFASDEFKKFFSQFKIQVGSTGNLGMSIGIMSAALGFHVIVHMSADAKQWKKDLLRQRGAEVVEYADDYSKAVEVGRKNSDADPKSYFVDDENSVTLFLGYAVAAKRIRAQFEEKGIIVDADHPLFVYIPCGVGGAPGGVTFGLKQIFGDNAHVFFIEPTQAPCMLVGMASGLQNEVSVQDFGLTGKTHADGLAVGRASGFVGSVMNHMLAGILSLEDYHIYDLMRDIVNTEDIFLEPSACASFWGPIQLKSKEMQSYIKKMGLEDKMANAVHIPWATGGSLVPQSIREEYMHTHLK
ncbi:D-serine ammonia-lyase [Anaerotignum lactatifermentans]|uniref:Probable D-serine dehydratase n=1 Tax=Anaerotignum lactatifermentans TaxID=160404 RepID=A0ABS2GBW3_9FIRM|nr:D-serine ammonia-lyase [Anaerotignum lactatifermentans]MBM6828577.1 D-serine ammonia-lyase [Anaerotignum lactatifermentans]MBM6877984.1 D-serine ammonia-lyase [Anaerotignum lactatifermentans]MBM6950159.1 D-serine ammonia-lyase [Anaerotignum lactatifermentans]